MYSCKILRDSEALTYGTYGAKRVRLTTFEITFPRIILAELNTHRALARNSASTRAIPTAKLIARVSDNPFAPTYWGKNQKGMSTDEQISDHLKPEALKIWLEARDLAVEQAQKLLDLGVAKQTAGRLLEPFMWQTAIVSATSTENLFKLRCHPSAQPEFRTTATMMQEALKHSTPTFLQPGEWHIPMVSDDELGNLTTDVLLKIATGRLARVSYLTHDGKRDLSQDERLHDDLKNSGHWSPFEHCAKVDNNGYRLSNFDAPWVQYRKFFAGESGRTDVQLDKESK